MDRTLCGLHVKCPSTISMYETHVLEIPPPLRLALAATIARRPFAFSIATPRPPFGPMLLFDPKSAMEMGRILIKISLQFSRVHCLVCRVSVDVCESIHTCIPRFRTVSAPFRAAPATAESRPRRPLAAVATAHCLIADRRNIVELNQKLRRISHIHKPMQTPAHARYLDDLFFNGSL